ncbi:MAG: nucleotidyltransferase domain-containing protein [Rubrobacter sp.]|nr:nucleotidyltransferase domain-containing protein [Rubrobacter sp.]MDQ3375798.1 nucleotidyltransferase domain-containing protein [Actinomycetota bacterium]
MLEMIEASRSELIDLCDRYGVRRLALFGSALRDDFDPGRSDLDLLVEFSPTSPQEHAEAYFGLLEDLESLFGRRVDLLELGAVRNPYLRREIEEQQETLYAAA